MTIAMSFSLVLAALAAQTGAAADGPSSPEPVFLGALATNVYAYSDRPIEVCGHFERHPTFHPTEHIMSAMSGGGGFWFYVDGSAAELPGSGVFGCVVGLVRRRDGLTPQEARDRGLPHHGGADTLQNPDYVLYPVTASAPGQPRQASSTPPTPPRLQHPGLRVENERLGREYSRIQWVVANELSIARRAMGDLAARPGQARAREAAHAAMVPLGADLRRLAQLQQDAERLIQVSPGASESDRAILRDVAQRYREILRTMERAYTDLLETLTGHANARPLPGPGRRGPRT